MRGTDTLNWTLPPPWTDHPACGGQTIGDVADAVGHRITPACGDRHHTRRRHILGSPRAGTDTSFRHRPADHPACGGQTFWSIHDRCPSAGSPPRAGDRHVTMSVAPRYAVRITPACGGQTLSLRCPAALTGSPPRAGDRRSLPVVRDRHVAGSPPRAGDRLSIALHRRDRHPDHPRVRGTDARVSFARDPSDHPRVRGTDAMPRYCVDSASDHPRVRGTDSCSQPSDIAQNLLVASLPPKNRRLSRLKPQHSAAVGALPTDACADGLIELDRIVNAQVTFDHSLWHGLARD